MPVNRGWRPTGRVIARASRRVIPLISNIPGMVSAHSAGSAAGVAQDAPAAGMAREARGDNALHGAEASAELTVDRG
jgi:hypothetical protein